MKTLGSVALVIGLVLGVVFVIAMSSGLLVLLAYGVGLVVNQVLHFDPLYVTIFSLIAVLFVSWVGVRLFATWPLSAPLAEDWDDLDEFDEDEEDEVEAPAPAFIASIPRWRQSLKNADFSTARPDDRCPCGSGRKFKNCHGARRAKS